MVDSGPIPTDFEAYLRKLEKRLARLERRPVTMPTADLLGPGLMAQAVQIMDWSSRDATRNGFYYTGVGGINVPDDTLSWTGQVIAKDDGTGLQQVWSADAPEPQQWTRTYAPDPEGGVLFAEWKRFLTSTGMIGETELDPALVAQIESGAGPTVVPQATPTVRATGMIDTIVLTVSNLETGAQVEYHASKTDGFTPSTTTLLAPPTRQTQFSVTRMPDGTAMAKDTPYYFKVRPLNEVGYGPTSTQTSASLDPTVASTLIQSIISATLVMAGQFKSGEITLDPDQGLVIPATSKASVWAALRTMDFILAKGGIGSVAGQMDVSGSTRLMKGVVAPRGTPTVTREWEEGVSMVEPINTAALMGLTDSVDGTEWLSLYFEIQRFNKATGAYISSRIVTGGSPDPFSITRIGSHYYLLVAHWGGADNGNTLIHKLDSAFNVVDKWYLAASDNLNSGGYAAIGNDGTNLLVANWRNNGALRVRRISSATGATLDDTEPGQTGSGNITGILRGTFDYGATTHTIIQREGAKPFVYETTAMIRNSSKEWLRPYDNSLSGLFWDGTQFISLANLDDGTNRLYRYASNTLEQTLLVESTELATDGSPETNAVNRVTYTRSPRTFVKAVPPPASEAGQAGNDKATRRRVYAAVSPATPELQATVEATGTQHAWINTLATGTGAAPSVNGFDAIASPGLLEAIANGFWVDGNSDGSVGTGTFKTSVQDAAAAMVHPYARTWRSGGTQSIAASTWVQVNFNSTYASSGVTITSSGGIYTVTQAGLYLIKAQVRWADASSGTRRHIAIYKNGVNVSELGSLTAGMTNTAPQAPIIDDLDLAVGDTIEIKVWHNHTAAVNITGTAESDTRFVMHRLSAA